MGSAFSSPSKTRPQDDEEERAQGDAMDVFSVFLNDCCSASKHGFVQPELLHSAWVAYNSHIGSRIGTASDLAIASGYSLSGNHAHPVILGISLVHWPSGILMRHT